MDLIQTGNKQLYETIKAIDEFLISQNQVHNFDLSDSRNDVRAYELGFHNLISTLENNGVVRASELTVFELYQRIEFYEEMHRKIREKQKNS